MNKLSHTVWNNKYHIVFCTKYRKDILKGEVSQRVREITRQICEKQGVNIIRGNVRKNHIHLLVMCPPHLSISKLLHLIKGISSRKIQMEFQFLRKQYWGKHIWSTGYFCSTVGDVSLETLENYVENQNDEDEDDIFTVGY